MEYHILAFFSGFLLDLLIGDPCFFPHPVRLIGKLIAVLEKHFRKGEAENKKELRDGALLVLLVTGITVMAAAFLLIGAYLLNPVLGVIVEAVMTYQSLAIKSLRTESMKVYYSLKKGDIIEARHNLSMIVGRDTDSLEKEGIINAAIETVAENTSDGVISPMLYTALGGPILGFFFKAVSTMDSMIGYKNELYLYFGRAAAKTDDVLNYIPARISAGLMILAALFFRGFDGREAFRIYKRDKGKHASPNSAQTEAVCAGALGLRLAGPASYFGKTVKKPYIGDGKRTAVCEDIKRANLLMYITAGFAQLICLLFLILAALALQGMGLF